MVQQSAMIFGEVQPEAPGRYSRWHYFNEYSR